MSGRGRDSRNGAVGRPRPQRETAPRLLLGALTLVNLLNFIDRQVLFAVFPAVKADLGLKDWQLGLAGSAFIVVYMIATPIAGALGDRLPRLRVVAAGVGVWSVATVLSGAAAGFSGLLVWRALVGIGESCYAPLSVAMIADSFDASSRGRSLAIFNLAVPVGSALGYLLGGALVSLFGWRAAFFVVGVPGAALALALPLLAEPRRGAAEAADDGASSRESLMALVRDPVFALTTASMTALTFVLGALAAWVPTFLVRMHGSSLGEADVLFGTVTALAGFSGTMAGGWLGDRALRRDPRGHLLVSAAGLLLAAPFTLAAILARSPVAFWVATGIAEILLFLNTGPLNAVIAGTAAPRIRATALAVNILAIHLLGDALSPWLVGAASDRYGLRAALCIMPPMLVASGVLCVWAGRFVKQARPE